MESRPLARISVAAQIQIVSDVIMSRPSQLWTYSSRVPLLKSRCSAICEGGGDVIGVVTPLVGGVAQAFHDDRVVELRVHLGVQEVEGKEDREEQVEVERGNRVKEVRSCI